MSMTEVTTGGQPVSGSALEHAGVTAVQGEAERNQEQDDPGALEEPGGEVPLVGGRSFDGTAQHEENRCAEDRADHGREGTPGPTGAERVADEGRGAELVLDAEE